MTARIGLDVALAGEGPQLVGGAAAADGAEALPGRGAEDPPRLGVVTAPGAVGGLDHDGAEAALGRTGDQRVQRGRHHEVGVEGAVVGAAHGAAQVVLVGGEVVEQHRCGRQHAADDVVERGPLGEELVERLDPVARSTRPSSQACRSSPGRSPAPMAAGRATLWVSRSCTVHSGHEGTAVASSEGESSAAIAHIRARTAR